MSEIIFKTSLKVIANDNMRITDIKLSTYISFPVTVQQYLSILYCFREFQPISVIFRKLLQ